SIRQKTDDGQRSVSSALFFGCGLILSAGTLVFAAGSRGALLDSNGPELARFLGTVTLRWKFWITKFLSPVSFEIRRGGQSWYFIATSGKLCGPRLYGIAITQMTHWE